MHRAASTDAGTADLAAARASEGAALRRTSPPLALFAPALPGGVAPGYGARRAAVALDLRAQGGGSLALAVVLVRPTPLWLVEATLGWPPAPGGTPASAAAPLGHGLGLHLGFAGGSWNARTTWQAQGGAQISRPGNPAPDAAEARLLQRRTDAPAGTSRRQAPRPRRPPSTRRAPTPAGSPPAQSTWQLELAYAPPERPTHPRAVRPSASVGLRLHRLEVARGEVDAAPSASLQPSTSIMGVAAALGLLGHAANGARWTLGTRWHLGPARGPAPRARYAGGDRQLTLAIAAGPPRGARGGRPAYGGLQLRLPKRGPRLHGVGGAAVGPRAWGRAEADAGLSGEAARDARGAALTLGTQQGAHAVQAGWRLRQRRPRQAAHLAWALQGRAFAWTLGVRLGWQWGQAPRGCGRADRPGPGALGHDAWPATLTLALRGGGRVARAEPMDRPWPDGVAVGVTPDAELAADPDGGPEFFSDGEAGASPPREASDVGPAWPAGAGVLTGVAPEAWPDAEPATTDSLGPGPTYALRLRFARGGAGRVRGALALAVHVRTRWHVRLALRAGGGEAVAGTLGVSACWAWGYAALELAAAPLATPQRGANATGLPPLGGRLLVAWSPPA